MKPISILISAISFCLTSPTFAADDAGGMTGLTVSPSSAVYKSKADTTQKFLLTGQTNHSTDGKQLIQKEYIAGNNPSNDNNKLAVLNSGERNMALGDDVVAEAGQSSAPLNTTPVSQPDNSSGWKSLTDLTKVFSKGDLVDLFL